MGTMPCGVTKLPRKLYACWTILFAKTAISAALVGAAEGGTIGGGSNGVEMDCRRCSKRFCSTTAAGSIEMPTLMSNESVGPAPASSCIIISSMSP